MALLAITVVAATGVAVVPASATDAIEVVEATGHCPRLVDGGCNVHATGTMKLEVNLFGFWTEEDTCDMEVEMRVDSSGNAEIYFFELYATEAGTSVQECEVEQPMSMCSPPWETERNWEESGASTVHTVFNVCVDSDENDICGTSAEWDIMGSENKYWLSLVAQFVSCRITGTLHFESGEAGNSDIHINHL